MSAALPKSPLAPHNRVGPTPPKLAAAPTPEPTVAPAAADLDAAPQDAALEVPEGSADATLLAPAAAEPAPPAPPARLRFTQYAPGVEGHAEEAGAAAYDASMEASADSGSSWYERHIAANIARNKARMAALGLDSGLTGGARVAPRPRRVVNYSETRPRVVLSEEERAERAEAQAADRERKREEKLAKRQAKLAAAAERAAAKVEAAKRKDAKLAAFAAEYALSESNPDASPPDMSVLSRREGDAFRVGFLEHTVERYPGRKPSNREEYVIEADLDTKVALAGARPATKTDAAYLLDKAYADAGAKGSCVFRTGRLNDDGLWGVVLYKDRLLGATSHARADAIVAYYKPWLPPWQRS